MKNYSKLEIQKRTDRLKNARSIRTDSRKNKDEVVLWMLKQVYPNGLLQTDLQKWGIFDRTFLVNSLPRLEKQGLVKRKKEYHNHDKVHSRLLNRWFVIKQQKVGDVEHE